MQVVIPQSFKFYPCRLCALGGNQYSTFKRVLKWNDKRAYECSRGHIYSHSFLVAMYKGKIEMAKVSETYKGSEYISAKNDAEEYKDIDLLITSAPLESVGQEGEEVEKIVLHFKDQEKRLALNATNARIMEKEAGSDESDDWVGVTIRLSQIKVDFGGKLVPSMQITNVVKAK